MVTGVGMGGNGTGSGATFIGTGLFITVVDEILLTVDVKFIDPNPSPLPGFASSLGFPYGLTSTIFFPRTCFRLSFRNTFLLAMVSNETEPHPLVTPP